MPPRQPRIAPATQAAREMQRAGPRTAWGTLSADCLSMSLSSSAHHAGSSEALQEEPILISAQRKFVRRHCLGRGLDEPVTNLRSSTRTHQEKPLFSHLQTRRRACDRSPLILEVPASQGRASDPAETGRGGSNSERDPNFDGEAADLFVDQGTLSPTCCWAPSPSTATADT
jgi:hypothetical protein